jgi:hypothetical protein
MLLNKDRVLTLRQEENLDTLVAVDYPNVYHLK